MDMFYNFLKPTQILIISTQLTARIHLKNETNKIVRIKSFD